MAQEPQGGGAQPSIEAVIVDKLDELKRQRRNIDLAAERARDEVDECERKIAALRAVVGKGSDFLTGAERLFTQDIQIDHFSFSEPAYTGRLYLNIGSWSFSNLGAISPQAPLPPGRYRIVVAFLKRD